MRLRDQYDWIVLGDHPSALLSASLAAKLGLSVLVLPVGPIARTVISRSGHCVDPESNALTGIFPGGKSSEASHRGLLSLCLDRIGLQPSEMDRFRFDLAPFQVLTPKYRLELLSDQDRWAEEIRRELGPSMSEMFGLFEAIRRSEEAYQSFWERLPGRLTLTEGKKKPADSNAYPLTLKTLRKSMIHGVGAGILKNWLSSASPVSSLLKNLGCFDLAALCEGLWYGATGAVQSDPKFSDLLQSLALARTSSCGFPGGMTAYRDFLLKTARRLGVDAPEKTECRRVFFENGRLAGVLPTHQGNMVTVSAGILGCHLDQIRDIVTWSGSRGLKRINPSPQPMGWKFTIAIYVKPEAIPPGTTRRMIWQEDGTPPLEFELAHSSEYGLTQLNIPIIFLRTVLPMEEGTLLDANQRTMAARMLKKASELLPFLERHVERIYPEFRDVASELQQVYPYKTLRELPFNLLCFGSTGVGQRSGVEGLFLASGEAYPEYGPLGSVIAAVEAIAGMAHRSGISGPLG